MRSRLTRLLNTLPLQTVLTVPFVIQVLGVVGVVGYLSFKTGQAAVQDLASQLRQELTNRILQELAATVERPHVLNQLNASALVQGDLEIATGKGEHQLWQQAKLFPTTNLIYCGREQDGAFLGVGRSEGGLGDALVIQSSTLDSDYHFHYYGIGPSGNRLFLKARGHRVYDPRKRPWYSAAIAKGGPIWSDIYLDFDVLLPTITAALPVYSNRDGQLLGVCATDLILSEELNQFLRTLTIGKSGIAFIVEPSGLLLASSTEAPITVGEGERTSLLHATQSQDPLIQTVARYLTAHFGGFAAIQSTQLEIVLQGDRQFLNLSRFQDAYGLDWIVVVVVPESDFMEQITHNTQVTVLLCVMALLVTLTIGLLVTQWLTRPILALNRTAKDIAQGDWDKAIVLDRSDEIGQLSQTFASMAHQLKDSFALLEQRVEERTAQLAQLNQDLQRLAQVDGLTQVANRRHFDGYLDKEWQRLSREQQPLSLMLCDVDYFKRYNDTYGHQAGDRCLQHIAQLLLQVAKRPADLVARYGGEEFVIVLPYTDELGAIHVAQAARDGMRSLQLPHRSSPQQWVTLSIGIATIRPNGQTSASALLVAADRALYRAKANGRDSYCHASPRI